MKLRLLSSFRWMVLSGLLFFSIHQAQGQAFWHETFSAGTVGDSLHNYPSAQIKGSRRVGNTWGVQSSKPGYKILNTTPLIYGLLKSTPEYVVGGDSYVNSFVEFNTGTDGSFATNGDSYRSDAQWDWIGYRNGGSNVLWFSILLRNDKTNNGDFKVGFGYWQYKFGIGGPSNAGGKWSLRVNDVVYPTATDVVAGEAVVLAVTRNGCSQHHRHQV
ncbi:MAG: hypothetical protein HC842_01155 [Cytophagales bacterium]|nr:hypothetical protein [Cytophagales bacterium]